MTLPWVRIDSNIASHDKILALLHDPNTQRWRAAFSYVCAIGWSGDRGTDGEIPTTALPFVHGTRQTADLLVRHNLWTTTPTGWEIHNFAERQQTRAVAEIRTREARRAACIRWHGPECWGPKGCTRELHPERKARP
jgi:hypothetical protein